MARYLVERAKRMVFNFLLLFGPNPVYKTKSWILKLKHETDLRPLAGRYKVRLETLERQRETGLDNPAYRFARDEGFFAYMADNAATFKGFTWLDVGADTGALSLYLSEILESTRFDLCDLHVAPQANFPIKKIDGTHLDHEDNSYDLVLFSYVLHHAADDTIRLLRDAHRIARRYVVVTEDPKETVEDCQWAYAHDKRGTFRGHKEWRALFGAMGYSIVHEETLNPYVHSRHFYLLQPLKTA
jgi:SAM-dependent methyltransferase